ncbi:MAG: bifunctional hydroxymethylpyrimidine kinase/phosphomethylpyrimidine kinase [Methylacidiphilales bacterium]|nr:bifunctional hydroxymethylpyrimidine kinase/phosphomethylpyrimidine kinase [Candidatus Methylacidiphilales bacterium]
MANKAVLAALTIAGSDNSGGAGIQADLKTFTTLGVFGAAAVTCVVAEHPGRVESIHPVPPKEVARQIALVFEAFPVGAAKTGMLYSKAIIEVVARELELLPRKKRPPLVVDPVMVASSGALLMKKEAVRALMNRLLPLAALVTPNLNEAEVLLGRRIRNVDEAESAAVDCFQIWGVPFLIKGGHLQGSEAVDFLYDGRRMMSLNAARVPRVKTHGTGCTYSSAITACLARRQTLSESVWTGKEFVTRAIRDHFRLGRYQLLNQLPE